MYLDGNGANINQLRQIACSEIDDWPLKIITAVDKLLK